LNPQLFGASRHHPPRAVRKEGERRELQAFLGQLVRVHLYTSLSVRAILAHVKKNAIFIKQVLLCTKTAISNYSMRSEFKMYVVTIKFPFP
jgi:hypothetical protein